MAARLRADRTLDEGQPIRRLVEGMRARLWLALALVLLRLGLWYSAAIAALAILADLASDGRHSLRAHPVWAAALLAAPPLAALLLAARRRPSPQQAARRADGICGAGDLLVTAWEILVAGAHRQGAATLVSARALTQAAAWQRALARGSQPGLGSLLAPGLALAGLAVWLTLLAPRPDDPGGRSVDGGAAPAPAQGDPAPIAHQPPPPLLAEVIASLESPLEAGAGPPAEPGGDLGQDTASPGAPPGPQTDDTDDSFQPESTLGILTPLNGDSRAKAMELDPALPPLQSGADGSADPADEAKPGTEPRSRDLEPEGVPQEALPPGGKPDRRLARAATPGANTRGPGETPDRSAAGQAVDQGGARFSGVAIPPPGSADPAAPLGVAQQGLLERYWTELQRIRRP